VIEPTDEMVADAMQAHNTTGAYGPVVEAVLAIVERDLIARVEGKRDTGLCDCACDSDPVNPRTGLPMEHHCDCRAVTTAGVLLGDRRKTRHVAECTCDWDEP